MASMAYSTWKSLPSGENVFTPKSCSLLQRCQRLSSFPRSVYLFWKTSARQPLKESGSYLVKNIGAGEAGNFVWDNPLGTYYRTRITHSFVSINIFIFTLQYTRVHIVPPLHDETSQSMKSELPGASCAMDPSTTRHSPMQTTANSNCIPNRQMSVSSSVTIWPFRGGNKDRKTAKSSSWLGATNKCKTMMGSVDRTNK